MTMHIINYAVRGFIFLLGILLLVRIPPFDQSDKIWTTGLGVIFLLFGSLRLITYFQATRKHKAIEIALENDDSDDNDDSDH